MIKTNDARFLTRLLVAVLLSIALVACSSDDSPGNSGGTDTDVQADSGGDSGLQSDGDTRVEADSGDEPDADADAVSDVDAQADADAQTDVDAQTDGGDETDAGPNCLDDGHAAGERYPAGDDCNFCTCNADGTESCTTRTCYESLNGCLYNSQAYDYGERFASTDGCNECVCGASGLACTRRACPGEETVEEGAILLESLDDACGDDAEFTPQAVLDGLPRKEIDAPFLYERDRELSPEVLDDTLISVRLAYQDGFMICRHNPGATYAAIDMEILVEWVTADGAFNEGFRAYLRRNSNTQFVDAWTMLATAPYGMLNGSFTPSCRYDPGDYMFNLKVNADGSVTGDAMRVCETDAALIIGTFELPAF